MARERVTVTIREDLLQQVDRLVDGLHIRSRSQAFEFLLSKTLSDYRLKHALVLAGGEKKDVLIAGKNKFIAEIKGKPFLGHVLDSLNEFHIGNFLVYLDNFQQEIMDALNARKPDYDIEFILSEKPSGTIKPLLKAKEKLRDTFLLAYGDSICGVNFNEMLGFHKKSKALVTLALTTVSNPKEYGVVSLQGNKVVEFVQKPRKSFPSYLVSTGYALVEPEVFKHISRSMKSIELDLLPKLVSKGMVQGYPFRGKYINVKAKADLEKARLLL